jgi:glycosyltransferase involved in cell wall biosynthesis
MEDQMIAVSEAQAATFARVLGIGRAKITVIHNGVDVNRFTPQVDGSPIRAELDIALSSSLVGMVTGFYDYERCEDFLAAAAQVLFRAPTTRFMIIGGRPGRVTDIARKRAELEALARRLGLRAALRFSGFRTDMPRVMAALDVLVLPATFKTFGIAILEAMATGKPVVATNAGGVPEVVRNHETGLLVPPRDPTRLAHAILQLIRNPGMGASMGQRGREHVVQRFTAETTAERTAELYTSLWARRMQRDVVSHADLDY